MPIVLYLGADIKEYEQKSDEIIKEGIRGSRFLCEVCLGAMKRHSRYTREIAETGQEIEITVVWCRKCKKWHSLQPDFLLPHKHYSGNEIESVVIDSATEAVVLLIETRASGSTVRRWVKQIAERMKRAVGILKYIFGRDGQAVCEVAIDAGPAYDELEQVLEKAPQTVKCSGNKLGLANIWLGTNNIAAYI